MKPPRPNSPAAEVAADMPDLPAAERDAVALARALFAGSAEALFLLDPARDKPLDVNPAAEQITGHGRDELVRTPIALLFRDSTDDTASRLRAAVRSPTPSLVAGYRLAVRDLADGPAVLLNFTPVPGDPPRVLLSVRPDRSDARTRLREIEHEWQRVLEAIQDCLWSADLEPDGTWVYRYISPVVRAITGRGAEFYYPGRHTWAEVIHPDDLARVRNSDRTLLRGQRNAVDAEYQFRVVRPDRSVCWVRDRVRVTPGKPGQPARLDGVLSDVTARVTAEQAIRASEDRLRRITESNPNAILLLDAAGTITASNPAAELLFGRRPLERLNWGELGWRSARPDLSQATIRGTEATLIRPDGTRADVVVQLARLSGAEGRDEGVVASFTDLTARNAAAAQVRQQEARVRKLFEQARDAVTVIAPDFRIVYQTPSAEQMFGPLLGTNLTEESVWAGVHPDDIVQLRKLMTAAMSEVGRVTEGEFRSRPAGGRPGQVYECHFVNRSDDPLIGGLVATVRDVTERRRAEAELRQMGKMEAIGQLAGGIAHDFNNLLTAILGNLHLAQGKLPADSPAREALADAEQAAVRAAEVTGQLLGIARRGTIRAEPTDLGAVVDEVVRLLRRAIDPRIEISVEVGAGAWVWADAGQLHQVVMNLGVNARDAMPEGGRLELITAEEGPFVRLSVADTGVGIPAEHRDRIFDLFFTTKGPGQGTGLGLSMARRIVTEHGGRIECHSVPGRGTRFDIYLPRCEPPTAPTARPAPPAVVGGREVILFVDDESMIRGLGRTFLEGHGYEVLLANDGTEAVDRYRAERDRIQLVVMDLSMPRMSGQEALREIRAIDPAARVVLMSGYTDSPAGLTAESGAVGFLHKPFRLVELASAVRAGLDLADVRFDGGRR